jgi:hypothetical protein
MGGLGEFGRVRCPDGKNYFEKHVKNSRWLKKSCDILSHKIID